MENPLNQQAPPLALNIQNIEALPQFADVAGVEPSTQGFTPANWNDDLFGMIPIWHGLELDVNQMITVGAAWLANITTGEITQRTAINGLKLALSLKSMDPGNANPLLIQQERPVGNPPANILARENCPNLDLFPQTRFVAHQQVLPLGGPDLDAANQAEYAPLIIPEAEINAMPEDEDEQKKRAYCFIAAFMMKLLVKSADNVLRSQDVMKKRFVGFYGPSKTVSRFRITLIQAETYREALNYQSKIITTYTHALAYTQQTKTNQLSVRENGVLSYLGYLPFSYMGFHVYTLMLELKALSKVPLSVLLTLFNADIMAPTLMKIAEVVRVFERTVENPNRTIYFRYCAAWGPHYFAALRSKNCAYLLCTVSSAWKTVAAGRDGADPSRIVATQGLSQQMKRTLNRAGVIIGETLKASMLGGAGVSAAYTQAMADQGHEEEAAGEGEWDEYLQD
ncbi:TPA_asm: N [Epipactis gammacytorhabdovirus 1]|nr:TPA_asm: N [Epipactis gammacytorhabdovirus 1]